MVGTGLGHILGTWKGVMARHISLGRIPWPAESCVDCKEKTVGSPCSGNVDV